MGVFFRKAFLGVLAAMLSGCAGLSEGHRGMLAGNGSVLAYKCSNESGGDAGMAYFDKSNGLAMMVLSIGLDLTGRALLVGPMMIGEVFFGSSRIEFKIPEEGGQSVVTMYSAKTSEGAPVERVKQGVCLPLKVDAMDPRAQSLKTSTPAGPVDDGDDDVDVDSK